MKVIISCQEMYKDWIELLTGEAVYAKFLDLWFYTPDKYTTKAMKRRFADMVSCWLLVTCNSWWKLTPLWRRVNAKHCHVVASLQIKDCTKEHDLPRRLKTLKSDRVRTSRDVIEVKSENKVLNTTLIDKKAPPIDSEYMNWKFVYDITSNINISKWESIVVTMKDWKITHIDIFKKHTRLQHLKSLFWL